VERIRPCRRGARRDVGDCLRGGEIAEEEEEEEEETEEEETEEEETEGEETE
jgi:hypothetical protein